MMTALYYDKVASGYIKHHEIESDYRVESNTLIYTKEIELKQPRLIIRPKVIEIYEVRVNLDTLDEVAELASVNIIRESEAQ